MNDPVGSALRFYKPPVMALSYGRCRDKAIRQGLRYVIRHGNGVYWATNHLLPGDRTVWDAEHDFAS